MRIWDVAAGYLNRQSLLGEHRELHGLYSILDHGKRGYAAHPETRRWVRCLTGLGVRHQQLAAEMILRGYSDRTPLTRSRARVRWPAEYVTDPGDQFTLLGQKYKGKEGGRIPLPRSAQQLWAQHKYSVLARSPEAYRSIGRTVARLGPEAGLTGLAADLTLLLRNAPPPNGVVNAVEHMWGHVRHVAAPGDRLAGRAAPRQLFQTVQRLSLRTREPFLLASTALSELAVYFEARNS